MSEFEIEFNPSVSLVQYMPDGSVRFIKGDGSITHNPPACKLIYEPKQ